MSSSEVAAVGVCLRVEAVEIGLESQMVQEIGNLEKSAEASRMNMVKTYRLCEPATTPGFEPTQMSSETRCEKNGVGVLLELFVRNGFLDSNLLMVRNSPNVTSAFKE
jgi:hypothetical protein